MKAMRDHVMTTLVAGLFVVVPVYLSVLLLLKGMQSVAGLVRPVAALVPDWVPAESLFALLLVLGLCFLVGALMQTHAGRVARERMEKTLFERLPGYGLIRSLTQRLAGNAEQSAWMPALVETGEGLVPGFIIEELADGRLTVFVPSVPTPFAGAVYIIARDRVHTVDVPFTQAVRSISHWGAGSAELVAAMRTREGPAVAGV